MIREVKLLGLLRLLFASVIILVIKVRLFPGGGL